MRPRVGAGRTTGCARGRGTRCHRLQPGPGVLVTARQGSEMASQPLRTYSSSRYPNKGGKTAPQEYSVEPILVPVADGALGPRKLPWATLVKAIGHFKQSIRDIRQSHMLAHFNPLATDQKLPEKQKYPMPEKKIWGDQEPLSKVRTALVGVGQLVPHT